VVDLFVEQQVLMQEVAVKPRREDLARRGVAVEDLATLVELGLEGEEISRVSVGSASFPIVLRLRPEDRRDLDALGNLALVGTGGDRVVISEVADVSMGWTPNNVNREDVSRRIVVQHNVQGRALGDVVRDVESALEPVRRKIAALAGYSIRLSGQFEAQQVAERRIALLSAVSLLAMFLILFVHYRSGNLALQVLASIPMAMIGAVAAVVLTDQTVSVAVLVGLVSLAGLAARNCILLIDHYLHVMREEGLPFGREAVLKAGRERLVPVLMTALCTGIALVPIALSPDQPGRELLYPVATVILGGLVSSTLLDVLVTPGLFLALGRAAAERHVSRREHRDRVAEELAEELEVPSSPIPPPPGGVHVPTP
jgi:Cu/Ag efflux pump CusA